MIGWPSPRRKEESYRHVQRVCATLGAKASQKHSSLSTESLLEDQVALSIPMLMGNLISTTLTTHFITQFNVLALLEDGAFSQAPHLIREN